MKRLAGVLILGGTILLFLGQLWRRVGPRWGSREWCTRRSGALPESSPSDSGC